MYKNIALAALCLATLALGTGPKSLASEVTGPRRCEAHFNNDGSTSKEGLLDLMSVFSSRMIRIEFVRISQPILGGKPYGERVGAFIANLSTMKFATPEARTRELSKINEEIRAISGTRFECLGPPESVNVGGSN